MLRRIVIAVCLLGTASFALPTPAEAGLFGGRRYAKRSAVSRPSVSRSRGYAVRGVSPLTIRVSSTRYRQLRTFAPSIYRRR